MKTIRYISNNLHQPKLFFNVPYGSYKGCYISQLSNSCSNNDGKKNETHDNDELEYDESDELEYEDEVMTDTEYDENLDDEDYDEDEYKDDIEDASVAYYHHSKL